MSEKAPIPLSAEMIEAVRTWAADDRLWGSRSTTEFNLCTFARVILKAQAEGKRTQRAAERKGRRRKALR